MSKIIIFFSNILFYNDLNNFKKIFSKKLVISEIMSWKDHSIYIQK
jgi:hypothetical protein